MDSWINTKKPLEGRSPSETAEVENSEEEEEGKTWILSLLKLEPYWTKMMAYQLPKHHCCVCHLLNLVSTVDASEANANVKDKRLSRSALSNCWSLWNKSGRSTAAAEIIQEKCKLQLLRPNETRWNSLFLAVERIVRIMREQGEGAITAVCSVLKIPIPLNFHNFSDLYEVILFINTLSSF